MSEPPQFRPFPVSTPEYSREALVLTEQVSDLAGAHADVACRDVGVRADVAEQLGHEALAEPHDLVVALSFRVEIRAALASAHREGGEAVFEDLLERQELQNAERDRRVEPEAAFVRPDRAVHLHAEASVDVDFALIVGPGNPEHDDPFRLDHAFEDFRAPVLRVALEHQVERLQHLRHGLMELGLRGVLCLHLCNEILNVLGHCDSAQWWDSTY